MMGIRHVLTASICFLLVSTGLAQAKKALIIHDAMDAQTRPYLETLSAGLKKSGYQVSATSASNLGKQSLAGYDHIAFYGVVRALNTQSILRDWLSSAPDLKGQKVSILVTANRWFNEKLLGQLRELLERRHAVVLDAVSMATQKLDAKTKKSVIDRSASKLR
jgi:hypothetical protein